MKKYQTIIILLIILAIASFFRLWHLNSIPPGLYPDEAMNGNNAIEAIKTGEYKVYYPENNGREGLFINLQALFLKVFGIHIWSLILASALIGILTVLGLYFLTLRLFNSQAIALLSSFFLATSFWHVNFSRIGFRAIMVPFFLVWSFYFFFKAINTKRGSIFCFLFSGLFFGLGFHTYIAFRMAVIILVIPAIIILLKFRKNSWRYAIWLLAIIAAALPIGLYFLNNPQDFIGRAGGVSVFAQENPIKALVISTVKTLGMFNIAGDFNWRHNFSGSPQLFWPIGILFLIGIIFSVKESIKSIKIKNYFLFSIFCFLLVWFFAMLLPAILTYEGIPHALRTIGVIPVCYIFAGLGAFNLYKFLESKKINKSLLFVACLLFLVFCGYSQYDKYFMDWAKQPDVEGAFSKNYVDIGNYLNGLPAETASYVIVNQSGVPVNNIPVPAQTVIFIQETSNKKQETKYLLPEEINTIEPADKLVVIPLQYDEEIFRTLKKTFPEGKVEFYKSFWLFEI